MIQISNSCINQNNHNLFFGEVEIRISNDGTPWSLDASALVILNVYEGGFFEVQLSTPARYIAIRRIGYNAHETIYRFFLGELRVFQHSNLLQSPGAKIMTDYVTPWDGTHSPENLIENLGNRSCSADFNPLIEPNTPTTEYSSCLISDESLMAAHGHKYVIPLEFSLPIHNKGILIVEGH